jgi:hypothetical protein
MKKLITVVLLFVAFQTQSQGFEGIVKWSMKMEITDPKMKAEMERAQQKMNDPANQAKMKEMEAKMKDPQMKAMMEANPQMKAQMEKMMKMQAGGGATDAMPKGMIMRIKGGNTLSKMDGGMVDGMEILHQKDKNQSVRLDRANKTYTVMSAGNQGGTVAATPKITKTGETATILGYACSKYISEVVEGGVTRTETFWTTLDIKDFDLKSLSHQRMQGGRTMLPEGIEGVPLKIEAATKEGKMIMEVTEIKREGQSAADFSIPADYKESKGRF